MTPWLTFFGQLGIAGAVGGILLSLLEWALPSYTHDDDHPYNARESLRDLRFIAVFCAVAGAWGFSVVYILFIVVQ